MTTKELLEKYFKFFEEKGHRQIPNVSIVPENDPSLLFVNSGMFPLVPYLTGEIHPLGRRLTNVQRSLRLADIEEIGDTTHTMAFHMIGNWSFGDYFKKEQLVWAYEFLVEVLGLDINKLYSTVFAGNDVTPKDDESISILKEVFSKYGIEAKEGERIFPYGLSNWWQRGDAVGELGGPDSEIFYYVGEGSAEGKSPEDNEKDFLEIGNSVFMQYMKSNTGWELLPQKNVDFGGGLERLALVVQNKRDIFETDSFWPIIEKIQEISGTKYSDSESNKRNMRILADHMRASVLIAMDGVLPSNKDQGYVLRRLLRRMVRSGLSLGIHKDISVSLVGVVNETIGWLYPQLDSKVSNIETIFKDEEDKFFRTLEKGHKELERELSHKENPSTSELALLSFNLFQSVGYPSEIFLEDVLERGYALDPKVFEEEYGKVKREHQDKSRSGAEGKFKGGLADHSEDVVRYHTATHIMFMALRKVLPQDIVQLGSNITHERLRFDYPSTGKLLPEQISEVEEIFKTIVDSKLPVQYVMLPKEEAIQKGAMYMKNESYPDEVKVYFVGETLDTAISKEFCGGPHISNTSELQPIEIYKQENIGGGKQRIYARFKK